MAAELFKEFATAFITERNVITAQRNSKFDGAKVELSRVRTRIKVLVNALADGMPARSIKDEMIALEGREDELNALIDSQDAPEPILMPNLANLYREKVAALHQSLCDPSTRDEAFGIIRTLIDEVRLVPDAGKLRVELTSVLLEQVKLVAGPGFEPGTFRL